VSLLKLYVTMVPSLWILFRKVAYSDVYDGWLSHIGTAPILEFNVIVLCSFCSFCSFGLFLFNEMVHIEKDGTL
jgi:hypothetical protein